MLIRHNQVFPGDDKACSPEYIDNTYISYYDADDP